MKLKRVISFIICSFLIIAIGLLATADNHLLKKQTEPLNTQICEAVSIAPQPAAAGNKNDERNQQSYTEIMNHLNQESTYKISSFYGGSYVDDNNILNVNIVDLNQSKINLIKKITNDDRIIYHNAKYTKEQLSEACDLLERKMLELKIATLAVGEKDNRIVAGFSSENSNDAVMNKIYSLIDKNMLIVEKNVTVEPC